MPCLTTSRLVLALFGTCALTAVIPHVGTRPRECESPPKSTASTVAARLSSAHQECDYGTQPYYFAPNNPATPWNTTPRAWDLRAFDARCQPRPLVDRLLKAGRGTDSSRQLSIILYGDR